MGETVNSEWAPEQVNLIEHIDPRAAGTQTDPANPPGLRFSNFKRNQVRRWAGLHPANYGSLGTDPMNYAPHNDPQRNETTCK